ncbi:hypothetical protein ILYODFUR_038751 [Ilyodon furcidens]|uniref:Uncharacterized protein n=1 Tax=Ilyodon furcidens TaxID=33524 RepID=A0ABV0U195_9TELE
MEFLKHHNRTQFCSRWRTHAFSLPPSCLLLHLLLSVFFSELPFTYLPNLQIMDLVSWSLNTIDQIFSTGRRGKGKPSFPAGTFFSGYTLLPGFLAAVDYCVLDYNVG